MRVEQPARAERDLQRFEVAPRRHLPADLGPTLAGGDRPIDPLQRSGPRVARERCDLRGADSSNRRQGRDVGERARVEALPCLVLLIAPVGQRELHRQHAGGVEAGIDRQQLAEADEREARACEQDDGEGDLRGDARIRPRLPSWIRSSSCIPRPE